MLLDHSTAVVGFTYFLHWWYVLLCRDSTRCDRRSTVLPSQQDIWYLCTSNMDHWFTSRYIAQCCSKEKLSVVLFFHFWFTFWLMWFYINCYSSPILCQFQLNLTAKYNGYENVKLFYKINKNVLIAWVLHK